MNDKYSYLRSLITLSYLSVASLSLLLLSCEIEETALPSTGSIAVAAFDSSGTELSGGKIYLDNIEREETTPDTLHNIPPGTHQVRVKIRGFEHQEKAVSVEKDKISNAVFALTPAKYGFLQVASDPPGAIIVLDRALTDSITPYLFTRIEALLHTVSVFRDGYLTSAPALDSIAILPEDTSFVNFELQEADIGSEIGDIAPDFTFPDDYGNLISLHDYRGYIVHLTFFFEDCPNCMEEFSEIENVYEDYSQYGVQIIGIDPWYRDDLEAIRRIREDQNITFKLLYDEEASTVATYNIRAYPTNIVINPSGEIVYMRLGGGLTYEILSGWFNSILNLPG